MANLIQPGTYEKLTIIGTRLEDGKVMDEPVIVITLAEPDTVDDEKPTILSHYLYTSDKSQKRTAHALKAYGWDPEQNEWAIGFFATPNNSLIGTGVGPVIVENNVYQAKDGTTKSGPRVKQIGDVAFGFGIGSDEARTIQSAFQKRMRLKAAQSFSDGLPSLPTGTGTPKQVDAEPNF
jgi:hypothetical protein